MLLPEKPNLSHNSARNTTGNIPQKVNGRDRRDHFHFQLNRDSVWLQLLQKWCWGEFKRPLLCQREPRAPFMVSSVLHSQQRRSRRSLQLSIWGSLLPTGQTAGPTRHPPEVTAFEVNRLKYSFVSTLILMQDHFSLALTHWHELKSHVDSCSTAVIKDEV